MNVGQTRLHTTGSELDKRKQAVRSTGAKPICAKRESWYAHQRKVERRSEPENREMNNENRVGSSAPEMSIVCKRSSTEEFSHQVRRFQSA